MNTINVRTHKTDSPQPIPPKKRWTARPLHGFLLLNKPLHLSSNKALQRAKKCFRAQKAGHTGSLDPLATGLLPIAFGEATKFCQYLLDADKTYVVTGKLGITTDSGDGEGAVIREASTAHVTEPLLGETLHRFLGPQQQIPPMHSAVKVDGKPLYQLARKGKTVERKLRDVTLFELSLLSFEANEFTVRVHCSKGTYMRSLIPDIGKALGCGAYVTQLHREASGPYGHGTFVMHGLETLEALGEVDRDALDMHLLPVDSALQHYPALHLTQGSETLLMTGRPAQLSAKECLIRAEERVTHVTPGLVRLYNGSEDFLGLGLVDALGLLYPKRLMQR